MKRNRSGLPLTPENTIIGVSGLSFIWRKNSPAQCPTNLPSPTPLAFQTLGKTTLS